MAIISGKNLYKSGRDTSLMSSVLAMISTEITMISTEITMIMAIHVTFGSIVYGLLNRLSVQYPLPNNNYSGRSWFLYSYIATSTLYSI